MAPFLAHPGTNQSPCRTVFGFDPNGKARFYRWPRRAAPIFQMRGGAILECGDLSLLAYGNTATGYRGTVHLSSSESRAILPGNYTFTATDNCVHTFSGVKLRTRGLETITVIDTLFSSISGSLTINVN